jgi:hypothetical protein
MDAPRTPQTIQECLVLTFGKDDVFTNQQPWNHTAGTHVRVIAGVDCKGMFHIVMCTCSVFDQQTLMFDDTIPR